MTFISYAQNFEDVLLWRALGKVEKGFYIDVGAAHPDVDSVTRAFYERGWRGVNVEPVREYAHRLEASRPEDVTLCVALADATGTSDFFVVQGTGLSTLNPEILPRYAAEGFTVEKTVVPVETLAGICHAHARHDIHFLKVDVEGSERAVLAGADFRLFRPWVVVVESTVPMSTVENHADWEDLLLAAEYRFVWFDGLNRFYVAGERHGALGGFFATPPNVFDDFVKAADSELSRRLAEAETRASRIATVESRAAALASWLHATEQRVLHEAVRASELAAHAVRLEAVAAEVPELRRALAAAAELSARAITAVAAAGSRAEDAERRAREASAWLASMHASSSWVATAPARRLARLLRGGGRARSVAPAIEAGRLPDTEPSDLALPGAPATPPGPGPIGRSRRVVHQFHSGSAMHDAITNAMLLTRDLLRARGYDSDIFVEHRPSELVNELRLFRELPRHDDYVLILRHSMGHDALDEVVSLPAPKILLYHNITPPEFLAHEPFMQRYARQGREQLAQLRDKVVTALADSEYSVLELRRLGFEAPRACTLLFDLDTLLARAARRNAERDGDSFTILFVGRIVDSKAQLDLVEAFSRFRGLYDRPTRLVLVGRQSADAYAHRLVSRIRELGLERQVVLTGVLSDTALHAWYAVADLYVSLSHHEGFGVPLVEAVAHGLPVLAWPSGAIPYTLGDTAGLLRDRTPGSVAARILEFALDPGSREALAARQRRQLGRYRTSTQLPTLLHALTFAGAAPPEHAETARHLAANLRFTIAGHVNKTYSLAAINRALALAIEAERPGYVRLIPVETVPTADLSEVPVDLRGPIAKLVQRPAHATGPEIVISQHYPVYAPPEQGDAAVALFFWEESLVPAATIAMLNQSFRAVFAPSAFVAKTLTDSGLAVPVHTVGHAPRLSGFRTLGGQRGERRDATITFLHVSSCFPRKGIDVLLAAYARAFRRGDRVRLVIKGFPNPHNDATAQVATLREQDPGAADIELIDRDLTEAELLSLYGRADALVLPSRGEGLNLPVAEAIAAGIPVIVTGFGGHLDFCGPASVRLLDYCFGTSKSHLATPHSVWAEPDPDDLVAAMRELVEDPDGHARRARRERTALDESFGTRAHVRRLTEAAVRVLLTPPARPTRLAIISTWDVRCGIAEYTRHLVGQLPPSRLVTETLVFADNRTAALIVPELGLRVRPAWQLGLPDGVGGLAAAITQEDPGIVLLQHQPGLFGWDKLASLLAGIAGRVVVVTLHNTRDLLDAPEPHRRAVIKALAGASRVVVHTIADLNLLKELGLTDRATLVPHGALPFRPSAAPSDRDEAAPLIGSYGFFLPDKGLRQLVEALAILRRNRPRARLRLVNAAYDEGESADEIARCRAAAEAAGVADAIEWRTEFLPDTESRALLAECDVIALPYQRSKEASSAALRMALGAGPPIIVTPLPLFDEAADAVVRFDDGSPAALADGLARLLADPDARAAAQSAARSWLADRDWTSIARRMQGMMLGLAAQQAVPPVDIGAEDYSQPAPVPSPALMQI